MGEKRGLAWTWTQPHLDNSPEKGNELCHHETRLLLCVFQGSALIEILPRTTLRAACTRLLKAGLCHGGRGEAKYSLLRGRHCPE